MKFFDQFEKFEKGKIVTTTMEYSLAIKSFLAILFCIIMIMTGVSMYGYYRQEAVLVDANVNDAIVRESRGMYHVDLKLNYIHGGLNYDVVYMEYSSFVSESAAEEAARTYLNQTLRGWGFVNTNSPQFFLDNPSEYRRFAMMLIFGSFIVYVIGRALFRYRKNEWVQTVNALGLI